ncbi:MAG: 23S rRNA (pseudouridine(1915)-N(3))-methyltransferase RlmH [Candidatus Eremiobacteraeota bacterium]|nr:23S rRNA (pseudouridine(1915)-N(3))-methyltransferase RlmH [Candidatus Eremiobacteraeota bacterium]
MNVEIIAVGRLREAYIRAGCGLYEKRLRPLMPISVHEVRTSAADDGVAVESDAILRRVGDDDILWALDQRGQVISSTDIARMLAKAERSGRRRLTLAIGGARGLSPAVLKRADFVWSLSELTFLHEMARLITLEQLYRAVKINRGEPYHR